jgi:flagellar biosynthesis protein FlhF
VDTAGKRHGDEKHKLAIQSLIQTCKPDEILLTVSATTSFRTCKEIVASYNYLGDFKLLMTKLDEVSEWGNLLNLATLCRKPLTYITTGQSVPDDIEQVDAQKIAKRLIG